MKNSHGLGVQRESLNNKMAYFRRFGVKELAIQKKKDQKVLPLS